MAGSTGQLSLCAGLSEQCAEPGDRIHYEVLGKVFDEMVALFPSKLIHIGGDEVAANTWMASPLARKLMEQEGSRGPSGCRAIS